ncbi:MAG TPA: EscU/YscU/HrcU family type III secretion system export apparatus switch protein [Polyangiaceae bacterium]|jgi:flagellar biosynthesis protein FlhB
MAEKTEQPSAKRQRKAREEGDSPSSAALSQGIGFVLALALMPALIAATVARFTQLFGAALGSAGQTPSAFAMVGHVLALSLPILTASALGSASLGFVQSGATISFSKLVPRLDRLNLASGLLGLFSWQRVVSVLRALIAAALVSWLACRLLLANAGSLANGVGEIAGSGGFGLGLAARVAWAAALVGLALGGLDLLLSRAAWLKRNRMSKDELKREHRESEGDPAVKAARRRAHQEALTGIALAAVRTASVVIVNPTHLATALKYVADETEAPEVVAQGQGEVAKLIIEAARAYGVPVVRDVPVARALNELESGDEIPEALYEAVAEILREIWATEAATSEL